MSYKVAVWGTGNVGRPAIRAVHGHAQLELCHVIVSNPAKVGKDAGTLAGVAEIGVQASDDWQAVLSQGVDAVVYAATSDIRPEEAMQDVLACLRAGANVVSPGFYSYLYPKDAPAEVLAPVEAACKEGNSSLMVSGIDPGWAMDILPILASGVIAEIEEIRCQEIFNYALYDAPHVVREVIGFGQPMDELPMMLHDFSLEMVWAPMVKILGDALDAPVDKVTTHVERLPLEETIQVEGMGQFDKGTMGAFRFEVIGHSNGKPYFVVEHITRIHDDCAPDWPLPPEGSGCHQVKITGSPNFTISVHGEDPVEPGPAGGGNGSAANRLVNALPEVCKAKQGVLSILDIPPVNGGAQLRR